MGKVQKASASPERGGPTQPAVGGGWERTYPTLFEYLTLYRWEDGQPRQTATLLIFFEDGAWKACLNDREHARSAWAAGGTPLGALQALEEAVCDDTVDWRRRKPQGRPSR